MLESGDVYRAILNHLSSMDQDTYVPGMNERVANVSGNAYQPVSSPYGNPQKSPDVTQFSSAQKSATDSPVVGFLYSLSNGGVPEYWPLKVGVNSIGKSADNDIVLHEGSVSAHHAHIYIKILRKGGGRPVASIKDIGSSTGLILNDEELDYEQHTLSNEDVLTVGLNYKLVAMLVDPTKYGLGNNEEFIAVEQASAVPTTPFSTSAGDTISPEHGGMGAMGGSPYSSSPIEDGTINLGGGPNISGGGTKIL